MPGQELGAQRGRGVTDSLAILEELDDRAAVASSITQRGLLGEALEIRTAPRNSISTPLACERS